MKMLRRILQTACLLMVADGIASASTFDPTFLDFGSAPGVTTAPMTITFTNDASGPIELTNAAITGANPDDFLFALIDPNDCVVTAKGPDDFNDLAAGESCDLQIKFLPTASGLRSAALSISYNDEFGNPQVLDAALTGEGTAHECDPDLDGTAGDPCPPGEVCGPGGGQIIENTTFQHVVLQRIKEENECESGDPIFVTQTTEEFEFGCDVIILGDLYDWPDIIVSDGTLTVNTTVTTTEIQYFCASDAIAAAIDIKFCSNPNGFNCKQKGVLPVTIFGSTQLDVSQIDLSTVQLCLASDTSSCVSLVDAQFPEDRGNPGTDVGTSQCGEGDVANPDGLNDIDVLFVSREVADLIECSTLGKDDASPSLRIKGNLTDGTPFLSNVVNDIGVDQLLIQTKK